MANRIALRPRPIGLVVQRTARIDFPVLDEGVVVLHVAQWLAALAFGAHGIDERQRVAGDDVRVIGIKPIGVGHQAALVLDGRAFVPSAAADLIAIEKRGHRIDVILARIGVAAVVLEYRGKPTTLAIHANRMAVVDSALVLGAGAAAAFWQRALFGGNPLHSIVDVVVVSAPIHGIAQQARTVGGPAG